MSRHASIIYLGPDRSDPAVLRRVQGLVDAGASVSAYAFDRDDFPSVDGTLVESIGTLNRGRIFRALSVFWAAWHLAGKASLFRSAGFIYCRNLDMALIGLLMRMVSRSRACFVYEVLDIHPMASGETWLAKLSRWIERRILANTSLLVVSSRRYISEYFEAKQCYEGNRFVLENKLPVAFPIGADIFQPKDVPPIVVGYFGKLRCRRSLELLTQLAKSNPHGVRVRLAGRPLGELSVEFQGLVELPNVEYLGQYRYPDEIPRIYEGVHLAWGLDFSDPFNSPLLLPNRVYESAASGVPLIAEAGTATGDYVVDRGLGMVVVAPFGADLQRLVSDMSAERLWQLRERLLARPRSDFVATHDHEVLLRRMSDV